MTEIQKIKALINSSKFEKQMKYAIEKAFDFFNKNYKNKETPYIFALRLKMRSIEAKANTIEKIKDVRNKWELHTWYYDYNFISIISNGTEDRLNLIFNKISKSKDSLNENDLIYLDYILKIKIATVLKNTLGEKAKEDNFLLGVWEDFTLGTNELKIINEINPKEILSIHAIEITPKPSVFVHRKFYVEEKEISYEKEYKAEIEKIKINVLKNFDLPEVKEWASKGLIQAFHDTKKLVNNESMYAFGLLTTNEFNSFQIICNTKEEYILNPKYLWSIRDWKYSFKISNIFFEKLENHFESVTRYYWGDVKEIKVGTELGWDQTYAEFMVKFYPLVENNMINLFKDTFRLIRSDIPEAVLLFWNYDPDKETLIRAVKKLNSRKISSKFIDDYFN